MPSCGAALGPQDDGYHRASERHPEERRRRRVSKDEPLPLLLLRRLFRWRRFLGRWRGPVRQDALTHTGRIGLPPAPGRLLLLMLLAGAIGRRRLLRPARALLQVVLALLIGRVALVGPVRIGPPQRAL